MTDQSGNNQKRKQLTTSTAFCHDRLCRVSAMLMGYFRLECTHAGIGKTFTKFHKNVFNKEKEGSNPVDSCNQYSQTYNSHKVRFSSYFSLVPTCCQTYLQMFCLLTHIQGISTLIQSPKTLISESSYRISITLQIFFVRNALPTFSKHWEILSHAPHRLQIA